MAVASQAIFHHPMQEIVGEDAPLDVMMALQA
jgi:hypothetical protein